MDQPTKQKTKPKHTRWYRRSALLDAAAREFAFRTQLAEMLGCTKQFLYKMGTGRCEIPIWMLVWLKRNMEEAVGKEKWNWEMIGKLLERSYPDAVIQGKRRRIRRQPKRKRECFPLKASEV